MFIPLKKDVEPFSKVKPDTFNVFKKVDAPFVKVNPEILTPLKKDVEPFIKVKPDTFKLL